MPSYKVPENFSIELARPRPDPQKNQYAQVQGIKRERFRRIPSRNSATQLNMNIPLENP